MFVPRPKVLSVRRDNPCGCPRTRNNSLTLPGRESLTIIKLSARFTARWHALGNPRRGFPTQKHSTGIFLLPSCAFIRDRDFALCAGRPKVSPLDSTAFKKAGEILHASSRVPVPFTFSPDRKFFRSLNRTQLLPGRESSTEIKLPARGRCGRQ